MIQEQMVARGICDARVLEVMKEIRREFFLPLKLQSEAYGDYPLSIGFGQTISQPYIVAYMCELADIQKEHRVLEIGTGCGYQTAVLACLAKEVVTVEIIRDFADNARERLRGLSYWNIEFQVADGWNGWFPKAPYDRIVVSAAADRMPQSLQEQLTVNGKIVIPVGVDQQKIVLGIRRYEDFETIEKIPVRFVPLVKTETQKD